MPTRTPTPERQAGLRTLSTDPRTGADDPDYENITLTFRNQNQPKGSCSPPKSKGKQPPTSPKQLGAWQGRQAACGGGGQQCGWGEVVPRLLCGGGSFVGSDDDGSGDCVGGIVGGGLDVDNGE